MIISIGSHSLFLCAPRVALQVPYFYVSIVTSFVSWLCDFVIIATFCMFRKKLDSATRRLVIYMTL